MQPTKHAVSPSETKAERSKFPPRVLIGVAAAILIPLLIAAGVMLKLNLPGGGELIVDCDDPNAKIQVVAVKDGQREDLSLTREVGNKLRLSEVAGPFSLKASMPRNLHSPRKRS